MKRVEADDEQYLTLALRLSIAMLRNGGETYRAEECARNILSSGGAKEIEILALPTGMTVTAEYNGQTFTRVRTLRVRENNLGNIDLLNTISREVSAGKIHAEQAINRVAEIELLSIGLLKKSVCACISSAFFTVIFGGGILEFSLALYVAFIAQLFITLLKKMGSLSFFSNMGGSILTAVLAKLCLFMFPDINMGVIIIGGIMPLLPGLATINAIRDTLYGDLISGAARGVEALLSAVSIAAGVALVLSI